MSLTLDKTTLANEINAGKKKTAKPMLWVAMVSMAMMFAGLVSAYVISSNREDWVSFDLPYSLYYSTYLIVASSLTIHLAKIANLKEKHAVSTLLILCSLVLGIGFVYSQFNAFHELKDAGLFFTGKQSLVSSSMLMVIVFAHLLHIFAAIIVLTTLLFKSALGKYQNGNILGLELGILFWHFLDLLWIILFCFFYFNT